METANLPSVVSLGLQQSQLDQCKNFVPTSYTVDVGQSLFTKPLKPEQLEHLQSASAVKLEDTDFDYDIEYSNDNVPLGEILERLQNDDKFETNDKSNLIRLHAANDSNAATFSATLNFATLDLGSQNTIQHHLSEINDVLFSISKPDTTLPLAISTSSPLTPGPGPSSASLSPPAVPVPDVNSMFCASPSPASSSDESSKTAGLLNVLSAQSPPQHQALAFGAETKTSPQECNLCNKMFGNASALAKHRLTHSDERKYLCTVCHKAFKRQDHLNGHLLTHRNKKPFECTAQGCNKSYCDARSLRRHRENHHSSKDDKLVSPSSSITSSDLDDKSLGSESCDGSMKGTKLVFTGINALDKEKLTKITTDTQQFQFIEQILRESKEESDAKTSMKPKTVRPIQQQQFQQQTSVILRTNSVPATKPEPDVNQNMVECSICSRKFKNIPALNGHMRLHGGYYRKDNDKNKQQPQQQQQQLQQQHSDHNKILVSTSEPLSSHRVSSNVISLIEEKIIQKRKLEPSPAVTVNRSMAEFPSSPPTTQRFTFLTAATHPSPGPPATLTSCSISSLCSTSSSVTPSSLSSPLTTSLLEPPLKRQALDNSKTISSLDNLVFPVLPQPDTDKLLANLQAKQQPLLTTVTRHVSPSMATLLPDSPNLPLAPLPEARCGPAPVSTSVTVALAVAPSLSCLTTPVNIIKDTQVKTAHQSQKLLKIQRTNFQPSIGDDHQAVLPDLVNRCHDTKYGVVPHETLMWSPHLDKFSEAQFESYLKLANSSAVKDNKNNVENALYILLQCNGSISKATQRLLGLTKLEDSPSSMRTGEWTSAEVDMFYEALCKHKKDFTRISADLPTKSNKDCVEFYYLWKNICREESQSFKSIINDNSTEIDSDILAI